MSHQAFLYVTKDDPTVITAVTIPGDGEPGTVQAYTNAAPIPATGTISAVDGSYSISVNEIVVVTMEPAAVPSNT